MKVVFPSWQGGSEGRHRAPGCPVECHSRIIEPRAKLRPVSREIGRREKGECKIFLTSMRAE